MSWEITLLLAVIVVCSTVLALRYMTLPARQDKALEALMSDMKKEFGVTQTRVKVVEDNQAALIKIADEARKMVSQQNLAQTMTPFGRAR